MTHRLPLQAMKTLFAAVTLNRGIDTGLLTFVPNIETSTILHAVATGADQLAQKVGRFVTGAQFSFENPRDGERGIEADIIQRGNRSHLVAQAERGFIRIFAAHDAFFDD